MKSLLIVEDDPASLILAEIILKDSYLITTATNGYEAIELAKKEHFDVVLMDINLGDINMDGINAMRKIRNNKATENIIIIAVTAFTNKKGWFIEQGFNELILKPLNGVKIVEMVSELLNKKRVQKIH